MTASKNQVDLVALLTALIPLADQLYTLLQDVQQNAPDAWAEAQSQYLAGVGAFKSGQAPVAATEKAASEIVSETEDDPSPPNQDELQQAASEHAAAEQAAHEQMLADSLAAQAKSHSGG